MSDDTHPLVDAVQTSGPPYVEEVGAPPVHTDSEGVSEDESGSSGLLHVCRVCEYATDIETPQRRTQHWCRGRCDGFQTFVREDAYEK